MTQQGEVTARLNEWSAGDGAAEEALFREVYPQLRKLAHGRLCHEQVQVRIDTTELVHEAYLKLSQQRRVTWQCRDQFFAVCATVIRRILIDDAKRRLRRKRGAGAIHVSTTDLDLADMPRDLDVLALDQALVDLAAIRVQAARIVELRFFAGLSVDSTAAALGLGRSTVIRSWRFARSWLAQRLGEKP